jgi:hypothetical protein
MLDMNTFCTVSVLASLLVTGTAASTNNNPTVDLGYAKYFGNSNATLGYAVSTALIDRLD